MIFITEICAVENCEDVTMMCQNNVACSNLYNTVEEKCNSFLQSDNLTCSDDCRQAVVLLQTHPIGYKMTCCDCGSILNMQCHLRRSKIAKQCGPGLVNNCEDCKASGMITAQFY